jgi:CubicO group peptidase (beta-lactamase class C family)
VKKLLVVAVAILAASVGTLSLGWLKAGPTLMEQGPPAAPSVATSPSPIPSAGAAASLTPSPPAGTGGIPVEPAPLRPMTTFLVTSSRLERTLTAWAEKFGTPGVSAAILWPGGRMWSLSVGRADATAGRALTTETAFAYASVTKTFTSALILQLVDEGRLELDEPVAPWLPHAGLDPRVTVRNLLDHTSGLPDFFTVAGIDPALNADRSKPWTADEALAYALKDRIAPDTRWRYSNTGYVYLGQLAEAVTGERWARLVRERFLDPLGLDHTFVQGSEAARGPVARGHRVTGTTGTFKVAALTPASDPLTPFTSVVTASGAAGAIAGTAEDAARWAAALYGGDVLAPETLAAAILDATRTTGYGSRLAYGLGVQVVRFGETLTLGHSGSFIGFRNQLRWIPDPGIAVVVLTNQSRIDVGALEKRLIQLALEAIPTPGCPTCQ